MKNFKHLFKTLTIIVLLFAPFVSPPASANGENSDFGPIIREQLTNTMSAVNSCSGPSELPLGNESLEGIINQDEGWYFRRIWLRFRPGVQVTLKLAKLSITPEVEMLIERKLPAGWSTFKK